MRITRVHIIRADTCGGLLDGLDVAMRHDSPEVEGFDPLCLVGANGAGKSQFLQVLAEAFQAAIHAIAPEEERVQVNGGLQFEIEYVIRLERARSPSHVKLSLKAGEKKRSVFKVEIQRAGRWVECDLANAATSKLLPTRIIGYTSGNNETLSLPFLVSRSAYADAVASRALSKIDAAGANEEIPDTRLMLVDYGTHLEVLVANLLLGDSVERRAVIGDAGLRDIHSFRCVVQLAHAAAPKGSARHLTSHRKGIQLTPELEGYIEKLKRFSTCYSYDEKTETYVFDFLVTDETRVAFSSVWGNSIDLYSALHKLSMLNDLAIPKAARERLRKDIASRRFASRLPEPQDEDRVFRFEQVRFHSQSEEEIVDYVSLSDGEHQLSQILGVMCMASAPGVVILLDEPESHFNPQWRVKFISRLMDLPTKNGRRRDSRSSVSRQECILTTHSPFVPSDMRKDNVIIFSKSPGVSTRRPAIETFGATFDTILDECFGVSPPISEVSRREIASLMSSNDIEEIRSGLLQLGDSVEKVFLLDRLRQLSKGVQ